MINKAIVSLLPLVPKSLVWKISRRYIAGTTLKDALECVGNLNDQGMSATLDVLGEDSTSREQALSGEALYQEALAEIDRQSLDANISVKLSMLALRFDEALCIEILQKLIRTAELHDSFVRIDMEDSSVTQKTLDIYRQLRKETERVGTVVQAYLRSTEEDVRALMEEGKRTFGCARASMSSRKRLHTKVSRKFRMHFCETSNRCSAGDSQGGHRDP